MKTKWMPVSMVTLALVSVVSCDPVIDPVVPVADFTFEANFLEVTFTDASTDAITYAWDFGVDGIDTDVSVGSAPTYTYAEDGTYTVSLTVTSSTADTHTITQDVTVAREVIIPVAAFSSAPDGLVVAFTDESTNAATYAWDFGVDGIDTDVSTEASPTFSYPADGTYTVTLTVTSSTGDTNSTTAELTLQGPVIPEAGFTTSINELTVNFTDASTNAETYAWDFGVDGIDTDVSTEASPLYTYAAAGTYTVTLTVTSSTGDTDVATENVTVSAAQGGTATFAAVLQNADFQSFPTDEMNNNDLVDAWTVDPDNNYNDGSESLYNFWRNDDLETWVSEPANNGGAGTTDKASSSGTDATGAGGTSDRSLKFDSSGERAYQPFEAEEDVTYNITAYVKSESTAAGELEGTFYILRDEPTDETDLASLAIATQAVNAVDIDTWHQVTFDFTVDGTFNFSQERADENANDILTSPNQNFVIFYFVPTNTVTSDNEIWLTDVVITTPGF
ncbi:MAG: PKD domain-containing protein [Bacteroidota bacterium]